MNVYLLQVPQKDKDTLALLMNDYLGELYQYKDIKLGPETIDEYEYFDEYWTDRKRHPLFIMLIKEIVGFTLIREISNDDEFSFELSEFYILPKHRNKRYGGKAVSELFSTYCGIWQLQVYVRNSRALTFWKNCIAKHVNQIKFEQKQRKDTKVWQYSFVIEKTHNK